MGRLTSPKVVPGDFQALSLRRAARARLLATRYPASRDALVFFAHIASFQAGIDPDYPMGAREALVQLVRDKGPEPLRDEARKLTEDACRRALEAYLLQEDTASHRSFFARVLLQPRVHTRTSEPPIPGQRHCPRCGHPPQVGCLRPEGDGTALSLVCSLCLVEWPALRGRCPGCQETDADKLSYYAAPEIPHLTVHVCDTCQRYLHAVDLAKELEAVPDVDEVAGLPLDVWAHEQGYRKIHPSLVGI